MQTDHQQLTTPGGSLARLVKPISERQKARLRFVDRARHLYAYGLPRWRIARELGVSKSTIYRWTATDTELVRFLRPHNRPVIVATTKGLNADISDGENQQRNDTKKPN